MKFIDVIKESSEDSTIKKGRILYKKFRIGSIEDTIYDEQDNEIVITIKYELPEKFNVELFEIYDGIYPLVKFRDWVNWDTPIDEDSSWYQPEVWIAKVIDKFWYNFRVILVDENFGEDLEDRDYLSEPTDDERYFDQLNFD